MNARTASSSARSGERAASHHSPARTRTAKPKLRVVDHHRLKQAARRRRMGLWLAGAVTVGMFVSALAQAELVRGQQELNQLRAELVVAQSEQARLEREIVMASAPHIVVDRARALGMVRATEPQYFPAVRALEG